MIIATVDVHDERFPSGPDHLHQTFETMAEGETWVEQLIFRLGWMPSSVVEYGFPHWTCPVCGFQE